MDIIFDFKILSKGNIDLKIVKYWESFIKWSLNIEIINQLFELYYS